MPKKFGKILLLLAGLLLAADLLGRSRRPTRHGRLKRIFVEGEEVALACIREGRFSRTLALVAGLSGVPTGVDVLLEHYRGSYGQKVMWSPVVLSGAMAVTGVWGAVSHPPAMVRHTQAICLIAGQLLGRSQNDQWQSLGEGERTEDEEVRNAAADTLDRVKNFVEHGGRAPAPDAPEDHGPLRQAGDRTRLRGRLLEECALLTENCRAVNRTIVS